MSPNSASNTATLTQNAIQNGNNLQNQYNSQVSQQYGNYTGAQNNANSAYGNLSSLTSSLPSNYLNYTNQIAQANGYNPQTLQNSLNNATTLSETMAGLPNAVNQMGNYSGATAGQIAQNYGNLAPGIATAQAGNNTALANQQAAYAAGQTGANNITGQQLTGANDLYTNAVNQMQAIGSVLNNIQNLQQQQGYLTAEQVNQYQSAYNQYEQAQSVAQQIQLAQNAANKATAGLSSSTPLGSRTSEVSNGIDKPVSGAIAETATGSPVFPGDIPNATSPKTTSTASGSSVLSNIRNLLAY